MKHKLELRLLGEISVTSDSITLMAESKEELRSLLMKAKGEWKRLFLNSTQKMKITASGPITSWQIDGETVKMVADYFLGLQNHCT